MSHVAWSVGMCVLAHRWAVQKRLNRSRWRLRDNSWVQGTMDGGHDRTNPFAAARGDNAAMRPFARLLLTLVITTVSGYWAVRVAYSTWPLLNWVRVNVDRTTRQWWMTTIDSRSSFINSRHSSADFRTNSLNIYSTVDSRPSPCSGTLSFKWVNIQTVMLTHFRTVSLA